MARAKQPVSVDDIEFDALIDSEEGYEADVPEYPTERGFSVSDTIVLKAEDVVALPVPEGFQRVFPGLLNG